MGHWLEQAQQSFATVSGGDPNDEPSLGKDQFQSIAMQAVASALSGRNGGVGKAPMGGKALRSQTSTGVGSKRSIENKGLTSECQSGYPIENRSEKVIIVLKFFSELPI